MTDIKTLIAQIRVWQEANTTHEQTRGATDGTAFVTFCKLSDAGKTITGHSYDDEMDSQALAAFIVLADEVERLQTIETHAVAINNALLTAVQSVMQFLPEAVQQRFQEALQPVIDLMETMK